MTGSSWMDDPWVSERYEEYEIRPASGPPGSGHLCAQLGLASFPSVKGRTVARLLGTPQPPWVSRPGTLPDLEPLSRTDLLTSRTRREIIALRDATVAAEARAAARDKARMPEQLIDEAEVL